jgi:hypothetical protein
MVVVVDDPDGVRTDWFPPPLLSAMPSPIAPASTAARTPTTMSDLRSTALPGSVASGPV